MSLTSVLAKLQQVRKDGGAGYFALCPAHPDHNPSLHITLGDDARVLVYCHAGCTTEDVLDRLGLEASELFPAPVTQPQRRKQPPQSRRIVATYDYYDATGHRVVHQTVRYEPKGFMQRQQLPDGTWRWDLKGIDPVLYNLPLVLTAPADDWVLLCEGEKDAETANRLGFIATTNPMGALKWHQSYTEALRDRKVALIPDNDGPGVAHGLMVAGALKPAVSALRLVNLPGLEEHGDLTDWVKAGGTVEQLLAIIDATPDWETAVVPAEAEEVPEFRRLGLGYVYEPRNAPIRLTFDYLTRRGYDVSAEVTTETVFPGIASGRLQRGRVILTSGSSKDAHARLLAKLSRSNDIAWNQIIETAFDQVVDTEREGEGFMKIGRRYPGEKHDYWVIDRLLPEHKMTLWYGEPGSCKSWTAAYMAVCLELGQDFLGHVVDKPRHVGVLDYEDDQDQWDHYVAAIAAGMGIEPPELSYRPCSLPLRQQINAVARLGDEEGVDVWIVDSFGRASGPVGQSQSYEEAAMAIGAVQRELGKTMMIIDHVPKPDDARPKREAKPIGSQYKEAIARAMYEVRKESDETLSGRAHIGIFDRKHHLLKPLGVIADWTDDAMVTFKREDLLKSNTVMAQTSVPILDRIAFQLQRGSLTVKDLADRLPETEDSIRTHLNRGRKRGRFETLPDHKWGLAVQHIYGGNA